MCTVYVHDFPTNTCAHTKALRTLAVLGRSRVRNPSGYSFSRRAAGRVNAYRLFLSRAEIVNAFWRRDEKKKFAHELMTTPRVLNALRRIYYMCVSFLVFRFLRKLWRWRSAKKTKEELLEEGPDIEQKNVTMVAYALCFIMMLAGLSVKIDWSQTPLPLPPFVIVRSIRVTLDIYVRTLYICICSVDFGRERVFVQCGLKH